jgi:hypothetical protein
MYFEKKFSFQRLDKNMVFFSDFMFVALCKAENWMMKKREVVPVLNILSAMP